MKSSDEDFSIGNKSEEQADLPSDNESYANSAFDDSNYIDDDSDNENNKISVKILISLDQIFTEKDEVSQPAGK